LAQVFLLRSQFVKCPVRFSLVKMRAVLSSGMIVLLGASTARAEGPSSALRGSASQESIVTAEEAATLDALSAVFFSVAEGSEGASNKPSNGTESLSLSSTAEMERRCAQGWSGLVESIAPGCLGQCADKHICESVSQVLKVWTSSHSRDKAKAKACEGGNRHAFDCLLWRDHRKKCQPLINRAPKFGIPANVNQACPRRLEEMPTEQVAAAETVEEAASGLPNEAAPADEPSVQDVNLTLDSMVTAALSSTVQGCHCSTVELKQCGMQCFSRPKGGSRIGCIAGCLDKKNHAHSCSQCYGRRSDCTMVKCLNKCAANPNAPQCIECVHSKCGGDCR